MHTQHLHAQVGTFKKVTTLWRRRRLATRARVFTRAQGKGGGRGGLASAPPPRREWRPGRHRRRDRHQRPRVSPGQAPCRHLRTSHNISRRVYAGDPGRPEVMHHKRTRIASDLTRGARGLPAPRPAPTGTSLPAQPRGSGLPHRRALPAAGGAPSALARPPPQIRALTTERERPEASPPPSQAAAQGPRRQPPAAARRRGRGRWRREGTLDRHRVAHGYDVGHFSRKKRGL